MSVLISIALLAAALIVVTPAWQKFCVYRETLGPSDWPQIKWPTVAILLLSLTIYLAVLAMGWFGPEIVQSVVILGAIAFIALALASLVVMTIWRIIRARSLPEFRWSMEHNSKDFNQAAVLVYGSACFHFAMVIMFAVASMSGAMDTAFDISVGSNTEHNFEMSRWMLRAGIPGFGVGLLSMMFGAFLDILSSDHSGRDES